MKNLYAKLIIAMATISFVACQPNNSNNNVDTLKQENDSLILAIAQTKAEYEDMLQLINEVQAGFNEIKNAEKILTISKNSGDDLDISTREKIANDMALITDILKKNKEKINNLEKQLLKSQNQSAQLKETINSLNAIIEEKTALITELQAELAKRDIKIAELDDAVTTLTQLNNSQSEVISSQDIALNRVFYAFGSSSELREQGIIEKRGKNLLKGDYNANYFTEADMRELKSITLGVKKAKLLTAHPDNSYTLEEDANGLLTLKIKSPEAFWSTSRYLVIEVD